jgi:hypothetical protein
VIVVLDLARNGFGVRAGPADHSIIGFNRVSRGGGFGGGIEVEAGEQNEVAFNNAPSVSVRGAGNRVERNALGFITSDGDRTYIGNNTVTDGAFSVRGSDSTIEYNTKIGGEFGILVTGSRHVLRRNLVLAARNIGVYVNSPFPGEHSPIPVTTGIVLLNNTVSRGAFDGIVVEGLLCIGGECAEAPVGTLLRHNRTRYNRGDGIRVEAPQTTLTRNVARHNGDLGIQAAAGVTDGGENRAAFNGNPAQCTGVVCVP